MSNTTAGESSGLDQNATMAKMGARALRGISWTFFARMLTYAILAGSTAVLARILSPQQFGLVSMAMVVTGLAEALRDGGLSNALIHFQGLAEEHRSTAFWIVLLAGGCLTAILALASPFVASLYGREELTVIIIVLAFGLTISASGTVAFTLLRKQLKFKTVSLIDLVSEILASVTAIAMAYTGFGVWSLVGRFLCRTVSRAALYNLSINWRPRFIFSFAVLKPLLVYGLPLVGFACLNYVQFRGGHFITGKYIGAQQLGFYALGQALMGIPLALSRSVAAVAFPVFASYQDQTERMGRDYIFMVKSTVFLVAPAMLLAYALTPWGLRVFLGPKWLDAASVFRVFAILSIVQCMYTTTSTPFLALGRTGIHTLMYLFFMPFTLTMCFLGSRGAAVGVALGFLAAIIVVTTVRLGVIFRLFKIHLLAGFRKFTTAISCTVLFALLLIFGDWVLPGENTKTVLLLGLYGAGLCLYALTLLRFDDDAIRFKQLLSQELSRMVSRLLPRRDGGLNK